MTEEIAEVKRQSLGGESTPLRDLVFDALSHFIEALVRSTTLFWRGLQARSAFAARGPGPYSLDVSFPRLFREVREVKRSWYETSHVCFDACWSSDLGVVLVHYWYAEGKNCFHAQNSSSGHTFEKDQAEVRAHELIDEILARLDNSALPPIFGGPAFDEAMLGN